CPARRRSVLVTARLRVPPNFHVMRQHFSRADAPAVPGSWRVVYRFRQWVRASSVAPDLTNGYFSGTRLIQRQGRCRDPATQVMRRRKLNVRDLPNGRVPEAGEFLERHEQLAFTHENPESAKC